MPDLHGARRELALRFKLVVGLAALGGFLGGLGRLYWLAAATNWPTDDMTLPHWFSFLREALRVGFGPDLAFYTGIGAAALALPALWLLIRPRRVPKPNF